MPDMTFFSFSYTSKNGTFLYFSENTFLIFLEIELPTIMHKLSENNCNFHVT